MPESLILIGASTGGPGHINKILQGLPENFLSSIIIAQHMSPLFIPSFIKQLATLTSYHVVEAKDGMSVRSSCVYVCSGECRLSEREGTLYIESSDSSQSLYSPNIDSLFLSAAQLPKRLRRMGVILTGIGDDGAKGTKKLYQAGGYCLFESEESSIVYGMPRSAAEQVPEAEVGSLEQIIEKIIRFGVGNAGMV